MIPSPSRAELSRAVPTGGGDDPRRAAGAIGRRERIALSMLLAVLFGLRLAYIFRQPFDSDEAQHLHVAWEWTQGHVQYRDFFDNHAPLFHLLTAPLLALVGERADVQVLARFAMLPLFVAALWLTSSIGRLLFGPRTGAWAAVLLGFHAEFFIPSIEFRTDDLWAVTWLLAVRVLIGGRFTGRRAFAGGLCVGLSFAVSMKTTLLAASLATATALVPLAFAPARSAWTMHRAVSRIAALLAGVIMLPGILLIGFAASGAFDALLYCTIRHNALRFGTGGWKPFGPAILAVSVAAWISAAAAFARSHLATGDRSRQLTVLLGAGLALSALLTVWPTRTRQDFLSLLPTIFIAVSAVLVPAAGRAAGSVARALGRPLWADRVSTAILVALTLIGGTRIRLLHPLDGKEAARQQQDLAVLLQITDRSDYVMDAKGDAVFRRRPIFYVLELFTKHRIFRGLIEDRIVEGCVETSTGVVFGDTASFTARARAFVRGNYLGAGRVRVAGCLLPPTAPGTPVPFGIGVPARYAIVAEMGAVDGTLDSTPYGGPRELSAGSHVFVPGDSRSRFAVLWAKAAERGYSPFSAPDGP